MVILFSFFTSIEFYVIMAVVAASVVAMAARPRTRQPVQEYLLESQLSPEDTALDDGPSIEFRCLDDGRVFLIRRGVTGVTMSGAVSAAAKFDGIGLNIEERLVEGSTWDQPAREALFEIDFLTPGRYHVVYNSSKTGLFVAFQLHVRPGISATRILSR